MKKKTNNDFAFLCLNKPAGCTSFDCIRTLRRILGIKKMGHLGTLDPPATGVLPIAIGRATGLIPYIEKGKKRYIAKIKLGIVTDTDDLAGKILRCSEPTPFPPETLRQVVREFVGEIMQIPPAISAVHINGKKAYKLAFQGKEVRLEPRKAIVHSIEILDYAHPLLTLELEVERGTYIRSIARDIGEKLGCGAAVAQLMRTKSGPFAIQESCTIDEVNQAAKYGELEKVLISPSNILNRFLYPSEKIIVTKKGAILVSHGKPIEWKHLVEREVPDVFNLSSDSCDSKTFSPKKEFFLFDECGDFLAVASWNENTKNFVMQRVFIV